MTLTKLISFWMKCMDGSRIYHPKHGLSRPATDFSKRVRLHTGKAESDRLGALLLYLAAQGCIWNLVPWRMLRNTYMGFSPFQRLTRCREKTLPPLFEEEPAVTDVMGGGRPIEELLIGVKDLLDYGLMEQFTIDGETYVFPTQKLLTCTVTPDNPMTIARQIFPFGAPAGFNSGIN